jgi:rod shape determining protein RodA
MFATLTFRERLQKLFGMPIGIAVLALFLALVGIAFIHSATGGLDAEYSTGIPFAWRQTLFLAVGLIGAAFIATNDYRNMTALAAYSWLIAVILLFACVLFGREINGAKSWIMVGSFGIQVSELCKPLYVITMAGLLRFHNAGSVAERGPAARAWWLAFFPGPLRGFALGFMPIAAPMFVTCALLLIIIKQPDFGTAMVFVPVFLAMCWASGARTRVLMALILCGVLLLPGIYFAGAFKPHQKQRIDTWMASMTGEPVDRSGDGYQVTMSMNAIGSGGVSGRGYGDGTVSQLGYLPERHTDFIYSVIAEEAGFFGACMVLVAFLLLVLLCLRVAINARDAFGRMLCVGVATVLFAQMIINIGMTCGVMPVTGLPLPFISYGGSSLVSSMLLVGLVLSVQLHQGRPVARALPLSSRASRAQPALA